jgi:putative membrane protein
LIPYDRLPAVNASLNALSGLLILMGFFFIRAKKIAAHRALMLSACVSSTLFLTSYLIYHAHAGVHRYPGTGAWRTVYLWILGTHTILAVTVLPLVIVTLVRALKQNFALHRKIARWTFPIWLYVSVTGVIVYFMLYRRR